MTLNVCWSAKGGSGTTVVAAALALGSAVDSLLVDLDGELPTALGVPEPCGQGLSDWFASDAPDEAVLDLAVEIGGRTSLVPRGPSAIPRDSPRWATLRDVLGTTPLDVVVDAGCGPPPPALVEGDARSLLGDPGLLPVADPRLPPPPARRCGSRRRARAQPRSGRCRTCGRRARDRPRRRGSGDRPRVDAGLLAAKLPHGMLKALQPLQAAA